MSESLITKKALGEALRELMAKHPYEKISVKDICDACGMNRNSFYYHFKDKQDLIVWIFDFEFIQRLKPLQFEDAFQFFECTCEYFYEHKAFYVKAFEITGQNCFSDYFSEVFHQFSLEYMYKYFGNVDRREEFARFTTDALRMALIRWLNDPGDMKPHELAEHSKEALFALADRCLTQYPEEMKNYRMKMKQ
ncbi:MAG: TetR/AcrR family transcriptional regulator C-terminal domain-containing protein [Oscillospiraceae bacterium]|nr:TetR/AcrR family transcriptional regulator C-terminal domain-containing protein [Oscillospiraceae bacterium]